MTLLPSWARKPNHKKTVIATEKGWVVKDTGEVLVSHKRLDEKLEALYAEIQKWKIDDYRDSDEPKFSTDESTVDDQTQTEQVENDNGQTEQEPNQGTEEKSEGEAQKVEQPVTKKKRRGRPPKKKTSS